MKVKALWQGALLVALLLMIAAPAQAHTLFMTVTDNDDGTVSVEGMYSTGAVAAATPLRLVDSKGKVLFKGLTDDAGELTFDKPKTGYRIILDGGPGHRVEEDGPR